MRYRVVFKRLLAEDKLVCNVNAHNDACERHITLCVFYECSSWEVCFVCVFKSCVGGLDLAAVSNCSWMQLRLSVSGRRVNGERIYTFFFPDITIALAETLIL